MFRRIHNTLHHQEGPPCLFLVLSLAVIAEWVGFHTAACLAFWWEEYVVNSFWKWKHNAIQAVLVVFATIEILHSLLSGRLFWRGKTILFLCCTVVVMLFCVSDAPPSLQSWVIVAAMDCIVLGGAVILLRSKESFTAEFFATALMLIDELKRSYTCSAGIERRNYG